MHSLIMHLLVPECLVDRSKPADKGTRCKQQQVEDRKSKSDSSRLRTTSLYRSYEVSQRANDIYRQRANISYNWQQQNYNGIIIIIKSVIMYISQFFAKWQHLSNKC